MIAALKAEFTKLITVRSTYFLTIFVLAVVSFISFYVIGIHSSPQYLLSSNFMQSTLFGEVQLVGVIAAVVGVLLLAHEYRYNTINYTLTISNSRTSVLASKFIVITIYSIVLCLVSIGLSIGLVHAGANLSGSVVGQQNYQFGQMLWQSVYSVWGMAMAGLILTTLIRNLVGSIVILFVFPNLEQLAGLLLKDNVGYLPFTALSGVTPIAQAQMAVFSVAKSAIIFAVYFVVLTIVAWQLFLRRDAN